MLNHVVGRNPIGVKIGTTHSMEDGLDLQWVGSNMEFHSPHQSVSRIVKGLRLKV